MKIAIILVLSLILLTGCDNNTPSSNYSAERTTYGINATSNENNNSSSNISQELFTYTTTIYTKTDERQNNVKLACKQLNNVVVDSGETFSFCDTLRPCNTRRWLSKSRYF